MKMKTWLYWHIRIFNIALSAGILVCCLFFGYIYYCNVTEMAAPKLGPVSMYVVISDSMVPAFQTNDAVFVAQTKPEKLAVGDVVAFYAFEENVTIIHRIIEKEQTPEGYSFRTQGDNNNAADSFATPDTRLIGKYLFQIPRLNFYVERIQQQPLVIAFPVVMLVLIQGVFGALEKMLKPRKEESAETAVTQTAAREGEGTDENQVDKAEASV